MFFNNGKLDYMGLVNSKDKTGKSVWIGVNEKGFAIMNSASYNLNLNDTIEQTGWEGHIIKKALATCATIEDFEKFLGEQSKEFGKQLEEAKDVLKRLKESRNGLF